MNRPHVCQFKIELGADEKARPRVVFDEEIERFWQETGRAHGRDVRRGIEECIGDAGPAGRPWAIIVLDREYRIGGHIAELRARERNIIMQGLSPSVQKALREGGDAPVAILLVRRKRVLAELADRSPILAAAWALLRHCPEGERWVALLPKFPAETEAELSANDRERYLATRDKDEIPDSEEALRRHGEIWRQEELKALFALGIGLPQEAESGMLKVIEASPGLASPHLLLGQARMMKGDYEGAYPHLDHVLKMAPRHVEARMEWARWHVDQGLFSEAKKAFERVLELDPFEESAAMELALLHAQEGDLNLAIEMARLSVGINGEHGRAWGQLGYLLYEAKRFEESAQAFEQAAQLEPDSKDYLNGAGYTLALTGHPEKGLPFCLRAVELDKDYCAAWDSLGLVYHRLGRPEEALKAFDECLRIDPKHGPGLGHRADLLKELGGQTEGK